MLVLFTDFGLSGPYVGQMKAVLQQQAPAVPVIDLFADAPHCNPRASAYLLPAYIDEFPEDSVFLCVVDPGVGSSRRPVVVRAHGQWFVGPDNGLLTVLARRASEVTCWAINWQPAQLSASFHGRDLFAPVAAMLARNELPPGEGIELSSLAHFNDWPEELAEAIYMDRFANVMTGLRAVAVSSDSILEVAEKQILHARTFSDVAVGEAFWYENSSGLVEIAVNQGRAAEVFDLSIGSPVKVVGV
ncbi:MAG: SAM-dependent chlorinase/fluorinase [Gammaproteobacteria bacterium]|nr:SAM-dependent chlorinase/fluorinase [Gammaproteobacteria bacterium]